MKPNEMKTVTILALACSLISGVSATATDLRNDIPVTETKGTINAVTVYRGQALVTRQIKFSGSDGLREIIVTDLPAHIVPGSIFAEADAGAEVRSVRFRQRPVTHDVREQVQDIQSQIAELRDKLQIVQRRLKTIEDQRAYLRKLEDFTASTATVELSRGVLDATTLKELSTYLHEQRGTLAEQQLETEFAQRDIQQKIEQLQREMTALGASSTRTAREAVVLVNLPPHRAATLNVHYLVDRATWSPSYTVRGNLIEQETTIDYFASIQQTSGEDWSDVHMTLSTATPSLVARAPRLTQLTIGLQPDRVAQATQGRRDNIELLEERRIVERARSAAGAQAAGGGFGGGGGGGGSLFDDARTAPQRAEFDAQLDIVSKNIQLNELTGRAVAEPPSAEPSSSEGFSIAYELAARTSLPSRSDHQLIQIGSMPMDGEFYRIAIPVLTNYVYEEATTVNSSDRVLLAGPVSTYANGQFVGHSEFEDISVGEEMVIGFGINSNLRSDRRVVRSDERVQGGNQVLELTYRLTIDHFGDEPIVVRLLDRLPKVKPGEIQLTILDNGAHTDRGVIKHVHDQEMNILRWDVEVPARAIGDDAAYVEYTIRLEYDRQMSLAGLDL